MITPTLDLERILAAQGYDLIAGFDEVGRGALAGPVMVGAPPFGPVIWSRWMAMMPSNCPGGPTSAYRTAWPTPK